MAKTYTVPLGNADRVLKYTKAERRYLEGRFKVDMQRFLSELVCPVKDGKAVGGGLWDAQVAFVFTGLRHASKKIDERSVEEWMEAYINSKDEEGTYNTIYNVLGPAVMAALQAGFLGRILEEEDEEGKDQEPVSTET